MTVIVQLQDKLVKWTEIDRIDERPTGMVCLYRARPLTCVFQGSIVKLEVIV